MHYTEKGNNRNGRVFYRQKHVNKKGTKFINKFGLSLGAYS